MLKEVGLATVGVALAGVFVGAVTMEVLHKKYPDLVKKTEEQARKTVARFNQTIQSFKNSFKEGYTQIEENAPATLDMGSGASPST